MPEREPQPTARSSADAGTSAGPVPARPVGRDELTRGLIEAVSHHIRSPLTVILGHVELWIGQHHEFPTELYESLATVLRAGQRLADVGTGVCDLFDVAFVDPWTAETVQILDVVAEEVTAFRDVAALRNIDLVLEGDPAVRCVVNAVRIRRAVHELIDNAVVFAPDGSTVHVAVSAAASGIAITVSDEGEGVDAADRERLVRPFERGANPRQPTAGLGMGMGLAVASTVASSHGGRLLLSEGPAGGLRASLELPADLAAQD